MSIEGLEDPIFPAIDRYRRAWAACLAVEGDIPDEMADRCATAYRAVIRTMPTTPAGLAALTTWARERIDWCRANASEMLGEDLQALFATIDEATMALI
jgi:hypothetical protein